MKKIIQISLISIIVLFSFSTISFPAWGQNNTSNEKVDPQITELNRQIQSKKDSLEKIKKTQVKYQQLIQEYQSKESSLARQMAILDSRLVDSQLAIEEVQIDIDTLDLQIQKINLEIESENKKITRAKKEMEVAIRLLQKEDDRTKLEILLSNDYLSDYLDQVKYIEDINSGIIDSLKKIRTYQIQLKLNRKKLEEKQIALKNKKDEIRVRQEALVEEQQAKMYIIDKTKNSEKEFQKLLAETKREHEEASKDIANLEKTVRQRIEKMKKQGKGYKIIASTGKLIWPIPSRIITCYFHDPTYPYRYLFEHPAIDIATPQGTQLKAADSGYVARAKTGGKSKYGYIMLVHDNGLATVYGHVSKIYVREDEFVTQGQIIGLSGGLPGTPGAGPLTTGPHLHFEVRLNGIPVNPLDYLP